ncbi:methionine synthase reductase isoform X2 [Drosophila tropicalis]|uniref:methionine synthase reductase isoform X2 n=1 Tax=Drosophila tropicalis TaxID=46794 RepID=UPI0035ABABC2
MVASTSLLNVDIGAYILNECVPAKGLDINLEICYGSTETITTCAQPAQMRCANVRYPFARNGVAPTSVAITDSQVVVEADARTNTKRVVELTLQLDPDAVFSYEPGDTIAILPHNQDRIVDELLQRLNLSGQADDVCHIKLASKLVKKAAKLPEHIPNPTNVREIFSHCLSLNGILKKQFLSSLTEYTTDERERCFLNSLSSKQGTSFYNELILERGLGFLDLMQICGSCQPSLALLIEHLPRLLPRPYSIANSPSCQGGLKIFYSILPVNAGATTSMLESKSQQRESKIFIYPREQDWHPSLVF